MSFITAQPFITAIGEGEPGETIVLRMLPVDLPPDELDALLRQWLAGDLSFDEPPRARHSWP